MFHRDPTASVNGIFMAHIASCVGGSWLPLKTVANKWNFEFLPRHASVGRTHKFKDCPRKKIFALGGRVFAGY